MIVSCVLLLSVSQEVRAAEHPILYFFWGDGCPHCEKEKEFLQPLQEKYPELEMRWFEVWKHPEFAQFADTMRKTYNVTTSSVPMTFLGDWNVVGYQEDTTTGVRIEEQVVACIKEGCADALIKLGPRQIAWLIQDQVKKNEALEWELFPATILPRKEMKFQITTPVQQTLPPADSSSSSQEHDIQDESRSAASDSESQTLQPSSTEQKETVIDLPLFGKVDVSQIGLPIFTLIIGGLDGFNPCAMWVLSFLLTLVIYAKSRAKILLIGGIFVIASGLIYFLFMAAWLNLFLFVGYVKYLRITVALIAIVMGLINCKDFFFFKKGVSLSIPESAQPKLFKRMRKVVNASALPAMILGTIFLAVTANLIELLCTAGFPAIYTRILTLQNLSVTQYYLYLAFYNVVYVIPLAVIVSIFAWKMGGRKLSEKEGRILKLIGGVLMLALGLILILKPQLLMF